jgi:hypothetical protein
LLKAVRKWPKSATTAAQAEAEGPDVKFRNIG